MNILSIIIPTLDRASLIETLDSIPKHPEVEIILIGDGVMPLTSRFHVLISKFPQSHDYGYTPRNIGLSVASGKWIAFMDDDNFYNPGGIEAILDYCHHSDVPALFRMNFLGQKVLWTEKILKEGGIGLPQIVVPNSVSLPKFGTRYEADFDWMKEVINTRFCGKVSWQDFITTTCPVESKGN